MTPTLPEEAVKAAKDVLYYANPNDVERALTAAAPHLASVRVKKLEWREDIYRKSFISDIGAVSYSVFWDDEAEWCDIPEPYDLIRGEDDGDTLGSFETADEAKAAAQADYEARVMSAIEPVVPVSRPSAARELALDSALRKMVALYESEYDADVPFKRPDWLVAALSSPDHADAGKVEGDGWLPIESAPKDGTPVLIAWQAVASVRGEKQWFQTVAHYDDSFEIAGYDEETGDAHKRGAWTDGAVASWAYEEIREISPTHWRPLPSAPSEGAE